MDWQKVVREVVIFGSGIAATLISQDLIERRTEARRARELACVFHPDAAWVAEASEKIARGERIDEWPKAPLLEGAPITTAEFHGERLVQVLALADEWQRLRTDEVFATHAYTPQEREAALTKMRARATSAKGLAEHLATKFKAECGN